jgi:hypothetical protein
MAIYHFSAKVISRANGSSAVASAAYRSASELHDERLGRNHDFSNKAGVIHSEVMLPQGAPERLSDRTTLWNEVEAGEKRKDAQLAREVEFSIPREMNEKQGVSLARDFVEKEFVRRGMVADLNVHWDKAKDGSPKPHAHVMLSMREVGPEGFGKKNRDWNSAEHLKGWREAWGPMSTSAWPSWGWRVGSTIAPMPTRASSLSRSTRSGRRGCAASIAARMPNEPRITGASRGRTAPGSSVIRASRWTASRGSNRPSPPVIWRCSSIGIRTARSSSTR